MNLYKTSLLIFILILLSGCTTTAPYRTEYDNVCLYNAKNDCPKAAITRSMTTNGQEYHLAFYEFDDQGFLHNRSNSQKILKLYKDIASSEEIILLTFVHGWHHNAQGGPEEDSNIVEFREILAEAANATGKRVLGVYIGWRGDSVRFPLLDKINLINTFTFWDRKNTAHEIGFQGLTSLLLQLEGFITETGHGKHTQVTIGHSFGGAALFSSVKPILEERLISGISNGQQTIEGYGDLVVLLNPAFEGVKYASLFELSQNSCANYSEQQKPRLAVLSSSADIAVGWAFPLGRRLNVFFETHNPATLTHCTDSGQETITLDTSYTDRYAVGHNRFLLTHELTADSTVKSTSEVKEKHMTDFSTFDWAKVKDRNEVNFLLTTLTSREITTPYNPYLNIWTNNQVMCGHNDIWTDEVKVFLYKMVVGATK